MHPASPFPGAQLDEDTATELEDAVDDGLTKKIAESSQFKPKGCESQGGGGGGKGISICSAHVEETEPEDSIFEELTRAPRVSFEEPCAAMAGGGRETSSPGDGLTKKIAESTQLKPKDVKAVLAALQTMAYADLNRKGIFVIPQFAIIKKRWHKVKGGRLLIGGNWRVEKEMND